MKSVSASCPLFSAAVIRTFEPADAQQALKLLDSSVTKSGAVILRYEPVRAV